MRVLVLGGTKFLGHAVAAEAVRRGHEVVCAARGESGSVPDGAKLVRVNRDDPDGLAPLAGERLDSVVDVATISYPWVRRALDAFAGTTAHWTFVSSISVYAEPGRPPGGIDDPLLPPRQEHGSAGGLDADPDLYGSVKVASERAVRDEFGEQALIVRAGLITGPGDWSDRFGYWPARMSRGGRVLVPDSPDQLAQYVDVRDLADWMVTCAERRLGGTYDATGEARPLLELLTGMAELFDGVELVPVPEAELEAAKVQPWAGPKSLPLWLPASHRYLAARDVSAVLAAGLTPRPLADAVTGALEHERTLGLDRERRSGLTLAEEAELLASR